MDYNKRRFLLEAIVDAVTGTERKQEQKCLICREERDLFPASIKITQGPGTYDFKAEVTSTALAKDDGWIELVDRNAELDSIADSKPVAICSDCAISKGLKNYADIGTKDEAVAAVPAATPEPVHSEVDPKN